MAKRFIKFVVDTEYIGTKNEIYMETEMNDHELDETLSELAYENAEDYDYVVLGWGEDTDLEEYYADAQGASYWEEVTKEEYEENMEGR